MTFPVAWGVLGTGGIAKKFAGQLPEASRSKLVAVASRSPESAGQFATEYGGTPYGSYAALLDDEQVEAIYISLPNTLHREWATKAMRAGKHVLCEKPIAAEYDEAQEMFDVARETGKLLVEAFMYRCHPAVQEVLRLVHENAIGQVKLLRTNFTFQRPINPDDIRYQPQMSGGSMMDVGCYCVNFARAIVGHDPVDVYAAAQICDTGVDEYAAGVLDFSDGTLATFTCGMTVQADRSTFIGGQDGYIAIDFPWHCAGDIVVCRDGQVERMNVGGTCSQYALEADAVAAAIRGDTDSLFQPECETLGNMKTLDRLRSSTGLSY